MAFKCLKPKVVVNELEWKCVWWHDRINEIKSMNGSHNPVYHKDPYKIQPRVRADGKTYCDKCDLTIVPFSELTTPQKEEIKATVLDLIECDDKYRKFVDGCNS